jgi:predicted HAD superfamily Cof-like phosphohydrolase
MSIKSAMDDVEAFHIACNVPVRERPIAIATEHAMADLDLRLSLINEECNKELLPAMESLSWAVDQDEQDQHMVKIADGLADLIYVCIGTAL